MNSKIEVKDTDNNTKKIVVHREIIRNELKDKLSDSDIDLSIKEIKDMHDIRSLYLSILTAKDCISSGCSEYPSEYINRCVPFGNINSNVMFINKMPTELECGTTLSHSDTGGHFLMLILNKLGYKPKEFYFTDFVKCSNKKIDMDSCWKCATNYLLKELYYIKPKLLIFEGTNILNILSKNNILTNIPDKIEYGYMYESSYYSNPVKVICIYDMDFVLKQENERLLKAKNDLWRTLSEAIRLVL